MSLPEGFVRINIIDTGYGIKEEDQDKIFDPFSRVSDWKENIEGTGIGLTVTKKLVDIIGGRIGFESELNKGSTFWVELPIANDKEEQLAEESSSSYGYQAQAASQTRTILYIEDNPSSRKLMQQIIKQATTHRLLLATDAEKGIEIVKQEQPDLILMDIDLPGMDGFAALDILQADDQTANIPVIAVSAHAMTEHVEKGGAANFVSYLTKPVKMDEVLEAIKVN